MVFVRAPQSAQVVVGHLLDGQVVNNVLNFFSNSPPTQQTVTELAATMRIAWTTRILPLLSVQMTLTGVTARDMSTQEGFQFFSPSLAGTVGGAGGDPCPNNVALCMTHRTAQIGRSKRGRTFFGGIAKGSTIGNYATASLVGGLTANFALVLADAAAGGWLFVVVSKYFNKLPRPVAVTTIVTSSSFRDGRVDSQRGRLPD